MTTRLTELAISTTGNITGNVVRTDNYQYANGQPFTGGGVSTYGNANVDAHLAGTAGNIIPVGNNVQSLGNATNQWADLWVSNNTIYINSVPVTLGAGNVLTVDGNAVLSNDSDTSITTTGNITADYFIGDGSQLTNLPGGGGLPIANGTSNFDIATANGNATVTTAGTWTWTFDTTGNLTIPNNIVSNTTIDIDNRASGNSADIQLFAADDILIQARDRTLGSTSEGGDINIYAGDSAEDGDSSGGDIQIYAGDGGAGNTDFGGSGGFITIRSGRGGAAIGNTGATAESGGSLTLNAGDAGDNNGNIDLGSDGGDIFIESGFSTGNTNNGGDIVLTTGTGGQNGASGNVQINIPGYGLTTGGNWRFNPDGGTVFPTLTITRGDTTGTLTGQTLLFGNNAQEAIISTPDGTNDINDSQRLVINPGAGADGTTGEGGDIYLYAGRGGDAGGSGGDIKIRGGLGPVDGYGGYIQLEGGEADVNGVGGYIEIYGGVSGNSTGGYLDIRGGQGLTGGDANVSGGFGATGPGGDVSIIGGGSANGQAEYGNVIVATGSKNWTFDNTGNLVLPSGTPSINYANGDPFSGTPVNTGNVTFDDNIVIGTGDEFGFSGLYLAIGAASAANLQYFRVRGGDVPTHLHFDTGNSAYYDQYFGDDGKFVKLEAGDFGNVSIGTQDLGNSYAWTFGNDGNLTIPAGGAIETAPGSAGNILLHPDDNGQVIIQGNNGGGSLLTVRSDASDAQNRVEVDTFGSSNALGGTFTGRFARGTFSSPQAVQGQDILAAFKGKGHDGTSYTSPTGQITIDAATNWSPTNLGTHISFYTTPINSNVMQESARLYAVGDYHQIIGSIIVEAGNISANGNVIANNIGNISAVNLDGNASTVLYGNGVFSVLPSGSGYGDSNVSNLLASFGSNTISTTGNISAANFFGNVANLTNSGNTFAMGATGVLSLGDAGGTYLTLDRFGITANTQMVLSATNAVSGNNSSILFDKNGSGIVFRLEDATPVSKTWGFYQGNVTFPDGSVQTTAYGNANVGTLLATFGSNTISTTGNVSVGNISAANLGNISSINLNGNASEVLYGNGVFAAIPAGSVYGNANVALFLGTYGSNAISTSGNVTAGYFVGDGSQLTNLPVGNTTFPLANGTSNINIATANDNITLTSAGSYTWSFKTDGNLRVPANSAIETAPGSAGNILFHPDDGGSVIIQGNTGAGSLFSVRSDASNSQNRIEIDTFGTSNALGGTFTGRFARGTSLGSLQAVQGQDMLAAFKGKGYDGTSYTNPTAQVTIDAATNWSPTNLGTHIGFYTTPINSNVMQESSRILAVGDYNQLIGNIIVTAGNISANGNVSGNYFIGNGSQLTGTVAWVTAPIANTSTGTAGQVAYDVGGNLYVCVSANTWSKFTGTTSW
jgi:hypothetical protein